MPARQDAYSVSIPTSPPPPASLDVYQRSMHQHTKRQMELANRSFHRRSGEHRGSVTSNMTNGSIITIQPFPMVEDEKMSTASPNMLGS
ncbi:hypothetical protein EV126DRAFT_509457 [Verticillium dahliae]|nr:hypothetical protein EV126DRAFT_509457 [Verticillium dahliae]